MRLWKNKLISVLILTSAIVCAAVLFCSCSKAPPLPSEQTPAVTQTPQPTPAPAPTPEPTVGRNFAYPFSATAQYFADDYMSLANLENTFTTSNAGSGATFMFKADPEYAQILCEGNIEFVTLANNHSGDYLTQGLADTKAALDAQGIFWAENLGSCIYQSGNGPTVGVYAALYPNVANVQAGVAALKEQGVDIIICALHWGLEGKYRPSTDQIAVGHAAIDAGAMIVYGSHPHVLQKTENYNGGYIMYSLGNWSFGGNTNPRDRDTAIIQVTVMRDLDGTLSISDTELIPCELSSTPGRNDYKPHPYAEGSAEYNRALSKLDGSFTGADLVVDYSAYHEKEEPEEGETPTPPEGGDTPDTPDPQPDPVPDPGPADPPADPAPADPPSDPVPADPPADSSAE